MENKEVEGSREVAKEGWRKLNSKKWHYFRNGKSLCMKWMSFSEDFDTDVGDSPDNCKKCQMKRNKEI